MATPQLIVVGAVVGLTLCLFALARVLGLDDRGRGALRMGGIALVFLAVPRGSLPQPVISVGIAVAAIVLFYLLGAWVPWLRGLAAVVAISTGVVLIWLFFSLALVVLCVIGAVVVCHAYIRIRRLRLSDELSPDGVQRRVAIGGVVSDRTVAPPPGKSTLDKLAWWHANVGAGGYVSGDLVLETRDGPIIVQGAGLSFDFDPPHTTYPKHTSERAVVAELGAGDSAEPTTKQTVAAPTKPGEKTGELFSYQVRWLPPGASVHVIGVPDWDRGPPGFGGYRDAPLVPVFRKLSTTPHLVDRPLLRARREAYYDVIAFAIVAASSAAIIAYLSWTNVW